MDGEGRGEEEARGRGDEEARGRGEEEARGRGEEREGEALGGRPRGDIPVGREVPDMMREEGRSLKRRRENRGAGIQNKKTKQKNIKIFF